MKRITKDKSSFTNQTMNRSSYAQRRSLFSRRRRGLRRRRGMILALTLLIITMLTLAAFTFCELTLSERTAAESVGRLAQARSAAESGVEYLKDMLEQDDETLNSSGGVFNNASLFQGILVADGGTPSSRLRFTIVAPGMANGIYDGSIRYGIEDESSKINVNGLISLDKTSTTSSSGSSTTSGSSGTSGTSGTSATNAGSTSRTSSSGRFAVATSTGSSSASASGSAASSASGTVARGSLMHLPGMTEPIADAILDWIDSDTTPRDFGAEDEYYGALQPSYSARNAKIVSADELLPVRDMTPWLLYGGDLNRNGRTDSDEPDPSSLSGVDNSEGAMTRGWSAYLTGMSKNKSTSSSSSSTTTSSGSSSTTSTGSSTATSSGTSLIDLNSSNLSQLYTDLSGALGDEAAKFIVGLRQSGPYSGTSTSGTNSSGSSGSSSGTLDLTKQATYTIPSLLDIFGVSTQVTFQNSQQATILASPYTESNCSASLTTLLETVTVSSSSKKNPVNINQASLIVLRMIPGMTEEAASGIVSGRTEDPKDADTIHKTEYWPLSEGIVTLAEMKAIFPYITAGGGVYRAQVIGFFDQGGPAVRLEVVLDATSTPVKVLSLKNISNLGRGYTLSELGVSSQ